MAKSTLNSEELGRKIWRDGFRALPPDANFPDVILGAGAELCHAIAHISDTRVRLTVAMTILDGVDEAAEHPCRGHGEDRDDGN